VASLAHWLYVQTRGQPLYLVALLKGLLEQEVIVPALQRDGTWRLVLRSELLAQTPTSALIPASLRELLRAQLGQLPTAAGSLLVAGAVMGEGLTFERLCQVAQFDEETGVQALEEVLRRGWLCEDERAQVSQAEGSYLFPGEMIRAVVYEAGATRQRLVQRRVAAALQEEVEHAPPCQDHLQDSPARALLRRTKACQIRARALAAMRKEGKPPMTNVDCASIS
jgi:predicted ATPase